MLGSDTTARGSSTRVALRPVQLRTVKTGPHPIEEIPPSLIELRNVSKTFQTNHSTSFTALSGVSLCLTAGTVALIRGPSGSGKSTLLGLIGCMTRPTSGRIDLGGRDVTRLSEDYLALLRRSCIGFVFQSNHLVRGASAVANVMLPAVPSPEMNGNLRDKAEALLAHVGLGDRSNERVERLSGGEQQRVAIARALVNDPDIILADEPTAHVDENATHQFLDFLGELRSNGKTVLVASHDQALAKSDAFSDAFDLSHGCLRQVVW